MHTQLDYAIVNQHQAELIQAAKRGHLIADVNTRLSERQPTTALKRHHRRITSAFSRAMPRTTRGTL